MWFKSSKLADKNSLYYFKGGFFGTAVNRQDSYETSGGDEIDMSVSDINENLYKGFASRNSYVKKKTKPYDIELIKDFLYSQLKQEDFTYGDVPSLKFSVENLFKEDESMAFMVMINMASNHVFSSEADVIEIFFALVSSLERSVAEKIYMTIVLIFLSHKESCAAEGSLLLLEKFGRGETAYANALLIRDFEHDYLNKYKQDVISYLRGTL
ncbi:hypothetical protein [Citrobacter freundii]|uniref:hypothetical protein n=1 Tax=Citrobacter freundii TaxID=546 RepID=UPI0019028B11|nr:hypothetical protein [Citrobacter freundii]MBJ9182762.1 hypothetical protein [Citrobacter freundii]